MRTKNDYESRQYQRRFAAWLKARGHDVDALQPADRPAIEGAFRMSLLASRGSCAFAVSAERHGNEDDEDDEHEGDGADAADAADELGADDADDADAEFEKWLDEFGNAASFGSTDRHLLHEHYRRAVAPDRPAG